MKKSLTDEAKSPEERAEDYARSRRPDSLLHRWWETEAFLAGRESFIEHELRGLLEKAREGKNYQVFRSVRDRTEWTYTIDEIIQKARGREKE